MRLNLENGGPTRPESPPGPIGGQVRFTPGRIEHNARLVERVLAAVPARSYAMSALLSLLKIEVTTAVPTASISCERRPVLRINPAFVAQHCASDEHLFLLVMHELHHVLLGHTRLFPRVTPAHNLAFDAVVNALLAVRFPARAYTSFFLDLYGNQRGPFRLLAPPGVVQIDREHLNALHRVLYGSGSTAQEVFRAIIEEVATGGAPHGGLRGGSPWGSGTPVLLGSHSVESPDDWGTAGAVDAAVVEEIRRIIEKWPSPEEPTRGRSLNGLLRGDAVSPRKPERRVLEAVRRALTAAARPGHRRARARHAVARVQVPFPDLRDRRGGVARATNIAPLLYDVLLPCRPGRAEAAASVYLDVSGSMDPYVPVLYGALSTLATYVAPEVHLFSETVSTVPLRALREGLVRTTTGTAFDCVLEHALALRRERGGAGKVLVLTDGYVGRPAPRLARATSAAGIELRVLLTPGGWRQDLAGLAARIDELPVLEGGEALDRA